MSDVIPEKREPEIDVRLAARLPESLPIANVLDNEHPCSYLPNRVASLPLVYPRRMISTAEFDHLLENGMRRSGVFMYCTACSGCNACEPSRVVVSRFQWSTSWRRILNRGDRMLRLELNIPSTDESRLRLFNLHRLQRNLSHGDTSYTEADYEGFLVESCCTETVELSFWKDDQLVAVSIIDCGLDSLSAVYTYFDPGHSQLSLGSYSVLKQMQLAQATDRRYVYLGMYVAANSHLNYKSRFRPQERYINSHWIAFE